MHPVLSLDLVTVQNQYHIQMPWSIYFLRDLREKNKYVKFYKKVEASTFMTISGS